MGLRVGWVLALVACGSSHDSGGGGGDDAAVGGDGGGSGSATGDAAPPAGLVRVHALGTTGAPVMGLHAVFVDADSTVTDTQTDSTGVAQATVSAGASVTLVCDHATRTQCSGVAALTTVQDLTPGDDVSLNVDAFSPRLVPLDTTAAGSFSISSTNEPAQVGLHYNYGFAGPCGTLATSTVASGTLTFSLGCSRASMYLVGRYNSGVGGHFYTAEKLAVPFADGGTAVISGPWIQDVAFSATYSNVDTTTASVLANRYVPDLRGVIGTSPERADVASGSATPTITRVGVATNAVVQTTYSPCTTTEISTDSSNGIDCVATHPSQVTSDAVDGTLATLAIDASTKLLPWVSAPNLVAANNVLTVPSPTGTGSYTVAEVDLGYLRNGTDAYTWRIFERQLGDVHLPALPSTIPTDPTPRSTDTVTQTHTYIGRSSAVTSWHDVVSNPYDALGACEASTDSTTKRFDVTSAAFSQSGY